MPVSTKLKPKKLGIRSSDAEAQTYGLLLMGEFALSLSRY
jgi:hypothetical protein